MYNPGKELSLARVGRSIMGIKFNCPHCKTPLNVKSELAGKRGRCPQCQQKIEIPKEDSPSGAMPAPAAAQSQAGVQAQAAVPSQSVATPEGAQAAAAVSDPTPQAASSPSAAGDPISEAPKLQWYVMPPGAASQYGPAVGEEFRNWIKEGRVTGDTLVWRQDWAEWKLAGAVFPELQSAPVGQAAAAHVAPAGFAIPTAAGALPTASGPVPMGMAVYPAPGDAATAWNPAAGGFPPVGAPTSISATGRRSQYRAKSNTGPMIVICVLVVVMIPLSYFVW
ncbi:MAG TPA: GYF domain-containing protein, partial [Pirellulales bacterium]|nr:GYF domain-containing protein [Pirellulales bacterium]